MRILVTGARGLLGSVLWEGLAGEHSLKGVDLRRDTARGIRRGDVRRARVVHRAAEQVDAIIDLATGSSVALPWDTVEGDMTGRVSVLEAARRNGVGRYIFASSNHVTGMYELDDPYASIGSGEYTGLDPATIPLISTDWPIRPDSPYGVGKAFSEAAARYYSEQYGISCVCLRIGTVRADDRPTVPRHYATLLSHADLQRLVECALRAPAELRYGVYYGVSANTWRFWDIANAADEIGFDPQDDAERFRSGADPGP